MMRILITDDHAVVRRGLRGILSETFPGAIFAEAGSGDQLFALLVGSDADLVLLDLHMPGRDGLDLLSEFKRSFPRLPVIVLSFEQEEEFAPRCLKAGASAYLTKESAPERLAAAAKKVLGGGRFISSHQADTILATFDGRNERHPHKILSRREQEVLSMIGAGLHLTEIADRLQMSVKTVSSYRARILAKTQAKNNAELIRFALSHGLMNLQNPTVPECSNITAVYSPRPADSVKKPVRSAQSFPVRFAKAN